MASPTHTARYARRRKRLDERAFLARHVEIHMELTARIGAGEGDIDA